MPNAYIVLGAESSGTRLMTKLLMSYGCLGSGEHEQPFDTQLPEPTQSIVWRRSIPHANLIVNLSSLTKPLEALGYCVRIIVMSRDWRIMAKSQVQAKHTQNEHESLKNIACAYKHIFSQLGEYPYTIVNYEALVLHQETTMLGVFEVLGLPTSITVNDENRKYITHDTNLT